MGGEEKISMKCIKYLLCLSNFAFVITALLVISVGTTLFTLYNDFETFYDMAYFSPALYLIGIGFILLIVSLFGFMGALKESTCMMTTFSLMLTGILIFELSVAIAAYITPNMDAYISEALWSSLSVYHLSGDDAKSVDLLQATFNCCGVDNYKDWDNTTQGSYPPSCCIMLEGGTGTCGLDFVRTDGCLGKLKYAAYQNRYLIASMALAVAFLQALGICFSWMLGRSIRKAKTEREIRRIAFRTQFVNPSNYAYSTPENAKTTVLYTPTSSDA